MEKEHKFVIENESQERVKLNLFQNFDNCVDAVMAIEGEIAGRVEKKDSYVLRQMMSDALAKLDERRDLSSDEDRKKFEKKMVSGFQGLGGFNRYGVRGDGSIALIRSHSTDACILKAQELGIETPDFF